MSVVRLLARANPAFPAEIMFVYGSLRTGGIETLIVRIANYFASSTARVAVCVGAGGELESLLDSRVNLIKYSETSDLIRAVRRYQQQMHATAEVLVISFDPISAARALMVEATLPHSLRITHVSGVFHPRAYFMLGERKDRTLLNYLVALAIGKAQICFINAESRSTHAAKWGIDLSVSRLLPLPINDVNPKWHPSRCAAVRVISVGRLVDFKAYNMGAAKIVKSCLDRGMQITWDIYGYGPQRDAIQAEIDFRGVTKNVRLMGKLDYGDLEHTMAGYDLFIGMGTAALEAAMVGLPTICATDSEAMRCYGYLHELPFGNVGELQAMPPSVSIAELVQSYSALGLDERAYLSSQCRKMAEEYSLPKFANALMRISANRGGIPPRFIKRLVAEVYRLATESRLVRIVRHLTSGKSPSA